MKRAGVFAGALVSFLNIVSLARARGRLLARAVHHGNATVRERPLALKSSHRAKKRESNNTESRRLPSRAQSLQMLFAIAGASILSAADGFGGALFDAVRNDDRAAVAAL